MTLASRKVLGFVLLFAPLFMAFLAVYVALVSRYDPLVLGAANVVTKRLSPAMQVEPLRRGGWAMFVFTPEEGRRHVRNWSASTAHLIYLSLVALPPLLLATPAPVRVRLRLVGIALPLAYAGHVLSVIVLMWGTECLRQVPGTFSCLCALRAAYLSGQLVAATLWVLLTWRYWFSGSSGRSHVAPGDQSANT